MQRKKSLGGEESHITVSGDLSLRSKSFVKKTSWWVKKPNNNHMSSRTIHQSRGIPSGLPTMLKAPVGPQFVVILSWLFNVK